MSSAVVFVFLLDNLAGLHNNLNESIRNNSLSQTNSTIQKCDTTLSEEIINAISQQLGIPIVPAWISNGQKSNHVVKPMAPASFQNMGTFFDNSFEYDNSKGYFDSDTIVNETYNKLDKSDCSEDVVSKDADDGVINGTKVEFPKSAPFLVAIFESVSNVTAHTCAGSLVSPRWVLTASSCVNLLANLYFNDTNHSPSHYTIVAGSTNPLSDGTVHNVTSILLHPDPTVDNTETAQGRRINGPFLALMRIDPEIVGETIKVVGGAVKATDVMVYGWVLSKNGSDHDTLNFTSMSATVLGTTECKSIYSYRRKDVLCLFNNDFQKNITLLSSGGPVLAVQKNEVRMLAVAQTDEHLFVAYSLTAHLKWIRKILRDKNQ